MTTFWDLPRSVRERIYRLNLVQETPLVFDEFMKMCGNKDTFPLTTMPCLMQADRKLELEAVDIFYRENTFQMNVNKSPWRWINLMSRPHIDRIRTIVVTDWDRFVAPADRFFSAIGHFKGLESLSVQFNEQQALRSYLQSTAKHAGMKWHISLGHGPQLQLQMLHFTGIRGLRSIRGLRHVEFVPRNREAREEIVGDFGPIHDGFLNAIVKKEMMTPREHRPFVRSGHFRFLDLPAELRTTIYKLLLIIPGFTYLTADKPTSVVVASRYIRKAHRDSIPIQRSVLTLLETSRQIHNEATGIFYRCNEFVFQYPSHLQAFTLSLEKDRLESVTNLVLFYKDHNEGGLHTMDLTIRLLRRMRGLKKFHLLMENHMTQVIDGPWSTYLRSGRPAHIRGAATLFSLRGIGDINVRDLDLEVRLERERKHPPSGTKHRSTILGQEAVLKHFNFGLRLAVHHGQVAKELYEDEKWHLKEKFPVLMAESECGREKGCSCE